MALPNPPQPSAFGAPAEPPRLVLAPGIDHGPTCDERIPWPHADCQRWAGPYLAGERQRRDLTVIVRCNRCGTTWRERAA